MRTSLTVVFCALLGACASPQHASEPPDFLFRDDLFVAPEARFSGGDVFALTEPMQRYLKTDIARQLRRQGALTGLIDALYRERQLKLEYDGSMTRNAGEAFDARAGNCLSLVIMTAAFAQQLGLQVDFHEAGIDQMWSRNGNLLVGSGHVNVTLGASQNNPFNRVAENSLTIDFLPSEEVAGLRTREIPQETVVAMYMNNKSVEALEGGQLDEAYGWARAAMRRRPGFASSYNTLGVVYLRHGDLEQAARVLRYALENWPANNVMISNLAGVLERMGDEAGAAQLRTRLAQIDPHPPYYFFDLGREAMQRGDYQQARSLFAKEVARADYNHEFHFWLGVAYYDLGDLERARHQILEAMERSQTRGDHNRYQGKLAWLKSNEHVKTATQAPAAP
ncbi:MAG TPA: tetratricopeptide repeat protein [Burkholderiaceae bacterium]|nr:tetratricopeptide repeat protein [Burkholderiaceae bacterium]